MKSVNLFAFAYYTKSFWLVSNWKELVQHWSTNKGPGLCSCFPCQFSLQALRRDRTDWKTERRCFHLTDGEKTSIIKSGREEKWEKWDIPPQKSTERRNYTMEVNEVSRVDEGKIAAKRGQCFLFSLSLFCVKWLRSRSILLEDAELFNMETEKGRCCGVGVGVPRLMVLSGRPSTWQCGNVSSVFSIFGLTMDLGFTQWILAVIHRIPITPPTPPHPEPSGPFHYHKTCKQHRALPRVRFIK